MDRGLMECVPNLSEGRDPEVVAALAEAAEVSGVTLLDRHSDPDHNRTVLTLTGSGPALAESAFRLAAAAVRQIDLSRHTGVHPRMGAIDVIPFVPLGTSRMSECVATAVSVAERIGCELAVPAYLYGAAARPGRPTALAAVRDGGFERLTALGEALPPPDFGPRALHPTAGAVAVGARPPLIAFNVILTGADLPAARRIAAALRASGGGLPGVQALAIPLASRDAVQVSMNLLDHRATSLATVLRELRRLAAIEGGSLASAELVGLAPAEALNGLVDDPVPGLPGPDQTIESRLSRVLQ